MPGFAMRLLAMSDIVENAKAFAHNHKGKPFETSIDLPNPKEGMSHKTVKQMSIKKCCIKGTWGAQIVDGLQESDFDVVIRRNSHPDTWM